LQIGLGGYVQGRTGTAAAIEIGSNQFINSSIQRTYIQTGAAAYYEQSGGNHQWYTAPSGTAGNAISFTQAMTLNANGNLLIGTTTESGTGRLRVVDSVRIANSSSETNALLITTTASTATIETRYGTPLVLGTDGSERARIDSSGNLLCGLTATSAYMDGRVNAQAVGSQPAICAKLDPAGSSSQFVYSAWAPFTTGDNIFHQFETETTATIRGSISYNRGAGLVAYNVTSDYRAKDISGPVVDSGAVIDSTPVYMGKMKGATQERPMFIAHETPAYAHTGEKDAVDADGNPVYQQMDASALIPVMWAEIQSLRARVAALEAS
jgi:hypothetical protein